MATPRDAVAPHAAKLLRQYAQAIDPATTDADRVRGYRTDPVRFCVEILGIEPTKAQRQILEGFLTYKRVSVVSGHKIGKSTALAMLAIWFYCSFPGARVVIMATTDRQVNGIIWREIKRLIARSRVAIPGADEIHERADSGLTNRADLAEIRGYTAKEAEAAAGTSGGFLLYLLDEASGIPDRIFEAIKGNTLGGNAWVFMISNPTRASGEFYDSHHSKSHRALGQRGYLALHFDSRESPNCTGEWRELHEWRDGDWRLLQGPIPGIADPDMIADLVAEYGAESPYVKIRIMGLFVIAEVAKVLQAALINAAQSRWSPWAQADKAHRLYIGVDPAGDGEGGDESGFAARRGPKIGEVRARAGMSAQEHIATIRDMIKAANWTPDELLPVVNVESEGAAGFKVWQEVEAYALATREFVASRIRTSNNALRQPMLYSWVRDELFANMREWFLDGGAIPTDTQLYEDLHATEFHSSPRYGKLIATRKKDLKRELGRSPDRGDAVAICCWEPLQFRREQQEKIGEIEPPPVQPVTHDTRDVIGDGGTFDPYRALGVWRGPARR